MDKWLEYEGFSRVAATGSFTAAADELGLTPSAVSRQVRSLEERLGVRLLHRTTRRVSLTAEGSGLYERLRGVLEDAREAEDAVMRLHGELRGALRVGAPMDFGRMHLVEPLAAFGAAHPQLELDVEFADRFVDLVEERFDLVVRIGRLPDSTLSARHLAPCRRVVCAAPDYLERHGEIATPRDLQRLERVAYEYDSEARWTFRTESGTERVAVPIRHRTNNGHMLAALVREGLGVALIPTFLVAADLREGRLVPLFAREVDGEIGIHAVVPHRRLLSTRVRSLSDFLAARLGPVPDWDGGLTFA